MEFELQGLPEEVQRLMKSVELAKEIQQGAIPKEGPVIEGYETGIKTLPAYELSGDFCDFVVFRDQEAGVIQDSELLVIMADAVGKDVTGGILASMTHALFHLGVRAKNPESVLDSINFGLREAVKKEGMFVTALCGNLDVKSGQFSWARAGHEIPLVLDDSKKLLNIDIGYGQPLNFAPSPVYDSNRLTLPKGGKLFLYTDGIIEAHDENGNQFGIEGLVGVVRKHWYLPTQEICVKVIEAVKNFESEKVYRSDDMTIFGISRNF